MGRRADEARADVDPARVGMLGVSHGAEVSLPTAARRNDVRAVVAEGAMGSFADARAAGASLPALAQLGALFALSPLLTGETVTPDGELVERITPRPLLLISAGRTPEANANRDFQRRAGASAETLEPRGRPARRRPPNRAGRVRATSDRLPRSSTALRVEDRLCAPCRL